ncbi:MAG: CHAT domain-containing protein [bacterium]
MAPRPVFFLAFANDRQDDRAFLRNLPEEKRRLRALLEGRKGQVEVVVRDNATLDEIFEVFQAAEYRDRIAVFHFAGHASSGRCIWSRGRGTEAYGGGLVCRGASAGMGLELVVLNGCSSAEHAPRLPRRGGRRGGDVDGHR